ncbi:uncharacterized protein LOC130137718 [Syzygium oleosum]|uniref:uncharacterized protein LOC130137718 n=1 Tax=Syzygium oleosum TaxID=219896 RepID=UPI0024BBA0F1|nr:uncharacterized protein LOC130137718 [Syzygium oleosum]
MAEIDDQKTRDTRRSSIGRCIASGISVFLTQFTIALIPHFLHASSLLIQLALSALVLVVVLGLGGRCRRVLGVYASAPAFVVMSIVYICESSYTDEEVEHSFEEFYEDVHTEFLKFEEIVNFKVLILAFYQDSDEL